MAFKDLREFLKYLDKNGQLVTVNDQIDPEPDIAAIGRASVNLPEGPAVLMNKIKGYPYPVAINICGGWANHALMMELPKETTVRDQFFAMNERWDKLTPPTVLTNKKDAPCKENIITKDINLFDVMALHRINDQDGGYYISKAACITRDLNDPESTGKENIGTYRIQVKGKDLLGIQALGYHDIAIHLREAEKQNKPVPIAIALGNHPLVSYMAGTSIAYDESEYDYVGALQNGVPLEVIKAEESNLRVPAGSEVILEGYILPRQRGVEGPFGEFPGTYSGARLQVEIKVTTITHRNNPIFENLYVGIPWTEIDWLMGLNTCVATYREMKAQQPEVVAVNALYTHGAVTIISCKPRFGGYAKTVAFRALCSVNGRTNTKIVIVVDENIDPFNLEQVMWCLANRMAPENDVAIIKGAPGMPLDPSSEQAGISAKMIIDATTPVPPAKMPKEINILVPPVGYQQWEQTLAKMLKK